MTYAKQDQTEKKRPDLIAYIVSERGEKAYWSRRGAAWATKDGKGFTFLADCGARYVLLPPKADQPENLGGAPT